MYSGIGTKGAPGDRHSPLFRDFFYVNHITKYIAIVIVS